MTWGVSNPYCPEMDKRFVTERHGDGLPLRYRRCPVRGGRADSYSGTSRDGLAGEIVAPAESVRPSSECHQGGNAGDSAHALCDSRRDTKSRGGNAFGLQHLLREQALTEVINDIAEYRAVSHPALRAFWRVLALHDIRRFRRDYLAPERRSFEAAVAASKRRRAA